MTLFFLQHLLKPCSLTTCQPCAGHFYHIAVRVFHLQWFQVLIWKGFEASFLWVTFHGVWRSGVLGARSEVHAGLLKPHPRIPGSWVTWARISSELSSGIQAPRCYWGHFEILVTLLNCHQCVWAPGRSTGSSFSQDAVPNATRCGKRTIQKVSFNSSI